MQGCFLYEEPQIRLELEIGRTAFHSEGTAHAHGCNEFILLSHVDRFMVAGPQLMKLPFSC